MKVTVSSILAVFVLSLTAGCSGSPVKDGKVFSDGMSVGHFDSVTTGDFVFSDRSRVLEDGIIEFCRTFTALKDIDSARVELRFIHESPASYAIIPAVCYNGNEWGRGKEPKGFFTDGHVNTYSYRRTPVPGATYSEGKKYAVAMWSDAPTDAEKGFSCAILPEDGQTVHSLIVPEEELPRVYDRRDGYAPGRREKLRLNKGDEITLKAYLLVMDKKPGHRSVGDFMDAVWQTADKSQIAPDPDNEQVWNLGIRYAKESLWAEDGPYKGFSIGLLPQPDGSWAQRSRGKYEVGWCGQNMSFANSLLTDYLKNGSEQSLDKALIAIDTWTAPETTLPNGLYITHWDYLLTKKGNPSLDACNLGTAAWMLFESADLLRQCGKGNPDRAEEVALGILDFAKGDQQPDGCYARGWYADGSCIVRDGTVGAFLIVPMVEASARTGDNSYIESAKAAYRYYYGQFQERGYTTAGALDTWCIDKESCITLLQGGLALYKATNDESYLDAAEQSAYYLTTWMWHYREIYSDDCDFTKYGLNTFGLTAVSVQHHHLDPYALKYVSDMITLAELTGKEEWKERARAIWNGGCQLISDGSLEINGRLRPAGSQNEAFLHCGWGWEGNPGTKRLNDWLVAWPGAFRLETLRRMGLTSGTKN